MEVGVEQPDGAAAGGAIEIVSLLQEGLRIAASRLEEAGLQHEDLRAVLAVCDGMLAPAPASTPAQLAEYVGPFVFGVLPEAPPSGGAVKFVFDSGGNRLVSLLVEAPADGWVPASPAQEIIFSQWILGDMEDILDHPRNYGAASAQTLAECQ